MVLADTSKLPGHRPLGPVDEAGAGLRVADAPIDLADGAARLGRSLVHGT